MAKIRPPVNKLERSMIKSLDKLKAFEEFETLIFPQLRKDLKAGLTADEIYKKYSHLAAARAVSISLTEMDSSKAIRAVSEILDRHGGKATERKEVSHKLDKLPDEQLDALLLTELGDLEPTPTPPSPPNKKIKNG